MDKDEEKKAEQQILTQELEARLSSFSAELQFQRKMSASDLTRLLNKYRVFSGLIFSSLEFQDDLGLYSSYDKLFKVLFKHSEFQPTMVFQEILEKLNPKQDQEECLIYRPKIYFFTTLLELHVGDNQKQLNLSTQSLNETLELLDKKLSLKTIFSENYVFPHAYSIAPIEAMRELSDSLFKIYMPSLLAGVGIPGISKNDKADTRILEAKTKAKEYCANYPYVAETLLYSFTLPNVPGTFQDHFFNETAKKQITKILLSNIEKPILAHTLHSTENLQSFQANKNYSKYAISMVAEFIDSIDRNFYFSSTDKTNEIRPAHSRSLFFTCSGFIPLFEKFCQNKLIDISRIAQSSVLLSFAYLFSHSFQKKLLSTIKQENLENLFSKNYIYFRRFFISPIDVYSTMLKDFRSEAFSTERKQILSFLNLLEKNGVITKNILFQPLSSITRIGGIARITPEERFYDYSFLLKTFLATLSFNEFKEKIDNLNLTPIDKRLLAANSVEMLSTDDTFPKVLPLYDKACLTLSLCSLSELDEICGKIKIANPHNFPQAHWDSYRINREHKEIEDNFIMPQKIGITKSKISKI